MYLEYKVKIPDSASGITKITLKGVTYIYYSYGRKYDPNKKYTVPINTTIGKCPTGKAELMFPNTNFLKYFPEVELPVTKEWADRSGCLRVDTFR